jgi:transposase-like protein
MAANWTKIKNEYINGGATYPELAEKYGVSYSTLSKRGAAERWTESRESLLQEISKRTEEKTAEKISEVESDVAAIMSRIRLKLTVKIEQAVDNMEGLDANELRKLVQSFKDMNDAQSGTEDEKNGMLNELLEAVKAVD